MTQALRYFKNHSQAELVALTQQVEAEPANQEPPEKGSIYRFTPAARKKLTAIAQAIAWHMAATREKAGSPVPVHGYSGRKSNR